MVAELRKLDQPWAMEAAEVLDVLHVSPDAGLDSAAVKSRRQQFGENRLRKAEQRSAMSILVAQFKSLVVLLLVAAGAISFAFGEWIDGIAILVVVLINAGIGFVTELRAVRSMEALREMGTVNTTVRRDGETQSLPAEQLVPGDVVLLQGGDLVTADLRVVESSRLQANESTLTGESLPVTKQVAAIDADAPLAERLDILFKGTGITRGSGVGIVVATGMDTELGHISSLIESAEDEETPLEERLDQLARKLIWVTLGIAALIAMIGIAQGRELLLMVETAIALAVAAIPEGLPIVATIALAHGMRRMARHNALVNRLSAVETLGSTNVICTDKTGTLTENRMTVMKFVTSAGETEVSGRGMELHGEFTREEESIEPRSTTLLNKALEIGILCNNASLKRDDDGEQTAVGDPVEVAFLVAGAKAGIERSDLLDKLPEQREEAFDPDVKMMATFHEEDGRYRVAVKGAPEAVLQACTHYLQADDGQASLSDEDRQCWLERNEEMATGGLRVLALAEKMVDDAGAPAYEDLVLVGLAGLLDPPRAEVSEAIAACHRGGVRVIMVTGDHASTARAVALAVGLVDDEGVDVLEGSELSTLTHGSQDERLRVRQAPILARVSPEQKLDLISLYQEEGIIVAMTGDGVNDAPALKKADIGVAMGERGTQVARDAADMVLTDDAFGTIVLAIEQGRAIFANIRKFVLYLLSCNISEVMTVGVAFVVGSVLPITPLQILFLNLVTDVFPALALGVGKGDPSIMEQPPREPDEPVVSRRNWFEIAGYGSMITLAVLGALAIAQYYFDIDEGRAVTISFLTLAFAQLWHVFNMRNTGTSVVRNEITRNPYVWGALGLCAALLLAAIYLPVLSDALGVVEPGVTGWTIVAGMSVLPLVIGQILKQFGIGKV